MPLVLRQQTEAIGTLTLNHPQRRNALSSALLDELIAGLDSLQAGGARVIVLRALRRLEGLVGWPRYLGAASRRAGSPDVHRPAEARGPGH